MKILLVNKYYHPSGGPETLLFDSIEKLSAMGHTVIPFSMKHPQNSKTKYERYFVSNVNYNNHSSLPWDSARTICRTLFNLEAKKKIEQLIKDTSPDIAHLHNIYHQLSPSMLLALKRHNIPVVMTLHDYKLICPNYTFLRHSEICEECQGKHFYKAVKYRCVKGSYAKSLVCAIEMYLHHFLKFYFKYVDLFVAVSKFSYDKFVQYGVPSQKLILLPPPVDLTQNKTQYSENGKYILFFGRLSAKNGIPTLLKAMKLLPNVELKMSGDGELREYVEREKSENISCLGFVPKGGLKKLLEQSYFTVFPNHYYHLCPSSILESFASGKPVIGSRLGSVPELIDDKVNGLLFEPRNERDLSEKITYLYNHPELVKTMGINARKKVEMHYSTETYYQKLLEIYENLFEQKVTNYKPSR
jgi:glycosyltransferase involved in cell wall biosynthesis